MLSRGFLLAAALVAICAAAYLPIAHLGFVFDDDAFLTANPLIKASDGLRAFWFTSRPDDYWPVTSTTLWLEWRLWGTHAAGYHFTNLLLHVSEALLLWKILVRLRIPGAYLAALLFAVHPVNVETVAWISQRKNLMAMLFFLLSILWFLKSDAREKRPRSWYLLSLSAYVLAMLSKGSAAPLPLVLALILWWQNRVSKRAFLRLVPYVLVGLLLTLVDVWFQRFGELTTIRNAAPIERLLGAGAVPWFYLSKALWPATLIFFYPEWHIRATDPLWWLPLLSALVLTGFLCRQTRGWGRAILFAWAYFRVMLLPVMGLTDVGFMKYALVADHYQHLALIGVAAIAAAAWSQWRKARPGLGPDAAAVAVVALAAILTSRQCSNLSRRRNPLPGHPGQEIPSRGSRETTWVSFCLIGGNAGEAIGELQRALEIKPDYAEAHINLGNALFQTGRLPEAVQAEYQAVLASPSGFAREAHVALGNAWLQDGREREAVSEYQAALRIDPGYSKAHYSLGNVLFRHGRFSEAALQYGEALESSPLGRGHLEQSGKCPACNRADRQRRSPITKRP